MPAKAGIQVRFRFGFKNTWIPAGAGMTEKRIAFALILEALLIQQACPGRFLDIIFADSRRQESLFDQLCGCVFNTILIRS